MELDNILKYVNKVLSIHSFLIIIFGVALLGFGLSIYLAIQTISVNNLWTAEFCFSESCFKYVKTTFYLPFRIAGGTVDLMVAVATIGGIFIALRSYISNLSNSALSNHIAHFSIFNNYLNSEITKHDKIHPKSIDILSWYNYIFTYSRNGNTDISKEYIIFINRINNETELSNTQAATANGGSFRYKDHQTRIIIAMEQIGIKLNFLPRNDFFEVEGQVHSLIQRVNTSFCFTQGLPLLLKRRYI